MGLYRCKMCGGNIQTNELATVAVCDFCGTEQTIASSDDAKKMNLHNRANTYRLSNDFDKALATYESILIDYPNDAEAHWGMCLCKYGIEYVDDPKTKKKIPTCHRTIVKSIFDDIDYKDAVQYADVVARRIYHSEAEVIDRIQKNILAISQKEEPYDIFICYKETDEKGNRTKDSVIAQEIYTSLTEKGYKVFFARITLESKLGTQYEPIIFAALQSAKVMLAIGSKVEYYNAPWVKNEWSRFLSFMKEQRGKYLIPCYKDMEAYDMPEEFLSLQSQNIDKLGFLQDLIYGIDKIFEKKEKEIEKTNDSNIAFNVKYLNLLKRANLCIEDKDYQKASFFIEEVLNENAECSEAYVALILIEFELLKEGDLIKLSKPLDQNKNYIKALRFADEAYRIKLLSYNEQIKNRIDFEKKEKIYLSAKLLLNQKKYSEAINELESIKEYKDSYDLVEYCTLQIQANIYLKAMNYFNSGSYDLAHQEFSRIIKYKDSELFIEKCKHLLEEKRKEEIYNRAISKIEFVFFSAQDTVDEISYKEGIGLLKEIQCYKDSNHKIAIYEQKLLELKDKIAKEQEEKIKETKRLELLKKEQEERDRIERINKEKIKKDRFKRFLKIFIPSLTLVSILLVLAFTLFIPKSKYDNAMNLINDGKIDDAELIFEEISDFKDAKTQIKLIAARKFFEQGDYEEGIGLVYDVGGEINIVYDTDGGSSEKSTETIKKAKYINNKCEKLGYEFYGWVLEDFVFSNRNYKVDLTLKASYTPTIYEISYDFNGGKKGDAYYPTTYTTICEDISIPNPDRKGYTFKGWSLEGSDEITLDMEIKKGNVGNKVYKAHWEANNYKVFFDTNGGTLLEDCINVTFDEEYVLPTPTKIGYNFEGWYIGNMKYSGGKWKTANDVLLLAWWIPKGDIPYTVNHFLQNIDDDEYTIDYESIQNLTGVADSEITPPTKYYSGFTQPKEETVIVSPDGSLVVNYYYSRNYYTVNFVTNGGETINNITQKYGSTYTLFDAERTGYTFGGWFTDINLTNTLTEKTIPASDIYLYAYWLEENKPVEFTYSGIDTITINSYVGSNTKIFFPSYIGGLQVDTISLKNTHQKEKILEVIIPNSVARIGYMAFEGCSSLKSITIPDSVTMIDSYAFSFCSSLESITIPDSVTSIGRSVFENCNLLDDIIVDKNNKYYDSRENCNAIIETKTNTLIIGCKNTTIPNSVTSIGGYAFFGCQSLKSITIPDSVTSIGEFAFYGCGSLKSITIPDSVTSIKSSTFGWCVSLESITIPNSITSIDERAFQYCWLEKVYYEGTKEEWEKISIPDRGNDCLKNATIYYVSSND